MTYIVGIGLVAATLTTLAFLPQVIRIWRTRSAEDVSLGTFSMFSTGVVFWLIYGLLEGSIPVIVSNAVTLPLAIAVLALTLRYRRGTAQGGPREG